MAIAGRAKARESVDIAQCSVAAVLGSGAVDYHSLVGPSDGPLQMSIGTEIDNWQGTNYKLAIIIIDGIRIAICQTIDKDDRLGSVLASTTAEAQPPADDNHNNNGNYKFGQFRFAQGT